MNFKDIIKAHLDKMAEQDSAFEERYNLKEKSLDKCIQYIFSEAQKQRKFGNCAAVEDAVVFGWAAHYYQEDDLTMDTNVKAEVKHKKAKASKPKERTKPIRPIKALVKDKSDQGKCRELDLFAGF